MKKLLPIIAVVAALTSLLILVNAITARNDTESISQKSQSDSLKPNPKEKVEIASDTLDYFYEIALGSEFGDSSRHITKWTKDEVAVKVNGNHDKSDAACLSQTINDFNALSKQTKLTLSQSSHDITLYFAPERDFKNILESYVPVNMGFFWTWFDGSGVLNDAIILIDNSSISSIERCHLIREELTQSMGLMNDSPKFSDSIFYTEWTRTTAYSDIDKEVISVLYGDDRVLPGMDIDDIEELFIRK